jgi:hypothetical protein
MSQSSNLQEAERRVFRSVFQDGLWDVFLGCFVLLFALAPLLSRSLGDFWSSAVFLPFWGLIALAIRLLRKHVIAPRLGVVRFGQARKKRLVKFSMVMLMVNTAALILGIVAAALAKVAGQVMPIVLGLIFLVGLSATAYLLDFRRLYAYGLLLALSPIIGEWLYTHQNVAHHGFPVAFGITAGIMILTGIAILVQFLRSNPMPSLPGSSQEA